MLLSLAMLSVLAVASCKKNDDKKDSAGSGKSAIMTTGKWQLKAQTYQSFTNGVAGDVFDEYADMETCEKDDYTIFTASKQIMVDAGATICDNEPQQFSAGQWSLTENETIMRQQSMSEIIDWRIEQLDDNTFRMAVHDSFGTTVHVSTLTYRHIK